MMSDAPVTFSSFVVGILGIGRSNVISSSPTFTVIVMLPGASSVASGLRLGALTVISAESIPSSLRIWSICFLISVSLLLLFTRTESNRSCNFCFISVSFSSCVFSIFGMTLLYGMVTSSFPFLIVIVPDTFPSASFVASVLVRSIVIFGSPLIPLLFNPVLTSSSTFVFAFSNSIFSAFIVSIILYFIRFEQSFRTTSYQINRAYTVILILIGSWTVDVSVRI